jgi:hypothetical protein
MSSSFLDRQMCGLLLIGFLCNYAMHAVNAKNHYQAPSLEAAPAGSKLS